MDTKDILKKVKKIEIKTKRLSDHIFSGEYHTSFKGRGMTFSEVRQYQFGDDVRAIDWNVTARYNEPYIKVFEEERELTLMLMVDVSGSENFGSTDTFKNEIVTEIAATLAFSATQNNDKIGLILFSDQIELFIPPKKGKTHVLRIIRELLDFKPKSQHTDLAHALEYATKVLKKKAIVFVLSDFITPNFESTLRITAKKHDITGIRVYDKREQEIPNVGLITVFDAETREEVVLNTSSQSTRKEYEAYFQKKEKKFLKVFQKCGAGTINIEVNDSYVKKLLGYFKSR
ncbi:MULTISPECIES: DUF58 domain-containing protein [Myroides]|uniref:DUF58 domain-containing protein n=1 Tax=Myroides albus TaxID=2562892 RepID=A0A6I3LEN7_9FLAO|nr:MULTISPECIES: DUF58 domain-containing protein [Myroides]MTG97929.1 DUF58 domain-containing protein [Myroides albus]MVX36394.1 DUF58 domain-containing protein [Myroides sp. LoEW2-1]UVD81117.1 DUF58 domain-containing protein [Myroides albus]